MHLFMLRPNRLSVDLLRPNRLCTWTCCGTTATACGRTTALQEDFICCSISLVSELDSSEAIYSRADFSYKKIYIYIYIHIYIYIYPRTASQQSYIYIYIYIYICLQSSWTSRPGARCGPLQLSAAASSSGMACGECLKPSVRRKQMHALMRAVISFSRVAFSGP